MSFDFQKYIEDLEARAAKNDIGKMLASGIGVGISQNSYLAITAMENVYVELENLTKNAAKNAENLQKKRQERELENLKNCLELELISEQEYYEKLKKYRDENLRQGSDAWYKYTEEIAAYNKRMMEEAAEEQLRMMKKIQSLQEELKEQLIGKDGDWYTSRKVTFLGINPGGKDAVFQENKLEDFADEIELLERYRDAVLKLKALGNIPDGVFAAFGRMETSEAVATAEMILSVDEETRQRFVSGYNTRNALADTVSAQLNGIINKEALVEAGILSAEGFNEGYFGAVDGEKTLFVKALEESFESVPQSYYQLGEETGDAFGKGFEKNVSVIMADARFNMLMAMNDMVSEIAEVAAGFAKSVEGGKSNIYNTTYTFNSSRDTTTMQLAAAKNAAVLEKLRGGN